MLKKLVLITCLGAVLEYFDFTIVLLFAADLAQVFLPESQRHGFLWIMMIHTAGYFVRPMGGVVFSHFGDLLGRKRLFRMSILIMSGCTLTMGLLPTYEAIGYFAAFLFILLRCCQGMSIGGEFPGAVVFTAEHVDTKIRGRMLAMISASGCIGAVLASLVGYFAHHYLNHEQLLAWGWRIPFIAGSALGVLGYFMRRSLSETPVFKRLLDEKGLEKTPIFSVFKTMKKAVLVGIGIELASTATISAYIYMAPYAMRHMSIGSDEVFKTISLVLFSVAILMVIGGKIVDVGFNKRTMMLVCSSLLLITIWPAYFYLLHGNIAMLGICTMLPAAFSCAASINILTELFADSVRYTGVALCLNIGICSIAGITPYVIEFMTINDKPYGLLLLILITGVLSLVASCFIPRYKAGTAGYFQALYPHKETMAHIG